MTLEETRVKQTALQHHIPVWQPENPNDADFLEQLKALHATYFLVIAYGTIFSRHLLDIPECACLNIHYSLLPRYRGSSPIQFALINGDAETGVSVIKMDEGMDTGDILKSKKTEISSTENVSGLTQTLTKLGIDCISEVLSNYTDCEHIKQNNFAATYTEKITPNLSRVNWQESASRVFNLYRALYGSPGVYFMLNDRRIKITGMRHSPQKMDTEKTDYEPGTVIGVTQQEIEIQCSSGSIFITEVKPENKREMSVKDFLNGQPLKPGSRLN